MKRIATSYIIAFVTFAVFAEVTDRPNAFLKAEYEAWNLRKDLHQNEKDLLKKEKYILQIAQGRSYYYDPQTYYIDSLENDPTGKAIREQALEDALQEFMRSGTDAFKIMEDKGLMPKNRYKCRKDFDSEAITVWNANGADRYKYIVPMDELVWELGDSIVSVLGYDCNSATADYHGRKWTAWFAPDIPVQDGPWQLCGLPGLIMKADTQDGEYGFEIKALQRCDESLKDPFESEKLFTTKRKSYLKIRDHTIRNRSAQIGAMTGGKVKLSDKVNYKGKDDFIETDYHD